MEVRHEDPSVRIRCAGRMPKVNLQIRQENEGAVKFYQRLGYAVDKVICMGKRLEHDEATSPPADHSG